MKEITKAQLKKILADHAKWLATQENDRKRRHEDNLDLFNNQ